MQKNLRDKLGLNIVAVDASERFLSKLAGVTDPEKKRKIIGNEFIAVFEEEAHRIASSSQAKSTGWCRARSIPTSSSRARVKGRRRPSRATTTSAACPRCMKLKLIEPLRDLFKDEVRAHRPRSRHARRDSAAPALPRSRPGGAHPRRGHAGARGPACRKPTTSSSTEIKRAGLYTKDLAVVRRPAAGNVASGVMGDQRTYAYTCAIRAVHSEDGMTADWVAAALRGAQDASPAAS